MPAITPAYQIVNPSYIMPEMILSYQQASGAFSVMASGNPLVRLADGDQYVYMKRLDIRTQVTSSQSGNANQLPSVALEARMVSTPTYMFRARAIYDHHDMAAAGNWGIALPEAQRLGTRAEIDLIIQQHADYGLIDATKIDQNRIYIGLCYSIDKPVASKVIEKAMRDNDGHLNRAAHDRRQASVLATNNALTEQENGYLGELEVSAEQRLSATDDRDETAFVDETLAVNTGTKKKK